MYCVLHFVYTRFVVHTRGLNVVLVRTVKDNLGYQVASENLQVVTVRDWIQILVTREAALPVTLVHRRECNVCTMVLAAISILDSGDSNFRRRFNKSTDGPIRYSGPSSVNWAIPSMRATVILNMGLFANTLKRSLKLLALLHTIKQVVPTPVVPAIFAGELGPSVSFFPARTNIVKTVDRTATTKDFTTGPRLFLSIQMFLGGCLVLPVVLCVDSRVIQHG